MSDFEYVDSSDDELFVSEVPTSSTKDGQPYLIFISEGDCYVPKDKVVELIEFLRKWVIICELDD